MTRRLLTAIAVFFMIVACSEASNVDEVMPRTLAGLERIRLITGQEAIDKVSKLHGKSLEIESCAIGFYGDPSAPSMVWISRATTPTGSEEQTLLMVERMEKGQGPFTGPEILTSKGVSIYQFKGLGQEHFIFYRGELAYWISAPPELGTRVLDDFF